MKIVRFTESGKTRFGKLVDDKIVDLAGVSGVDLQHLRADRIPFDRDDARGGRHPCHWDAGRRGRYQRPLPETGRYHPG